MKKQIINIIKVLLLSVFIVFTSCESKEKTYLLTSTLDLTGPNSSYGKQVEDGLKLAVNEINDNGGINDVKIELVVKDSRSEANLAVNNAQNFLSILKSKFIIGEISSNATKSMIQLAEENDALVFAPASSSKKLSNISPNFARNWPTDDAEAGNAAKFAINKFSSKKSFIVYLNNDYGEGLKNKFSDVFISLGGEVVKTEKYDKNNKNFKTILLKIKNADFDCLYIAGDAKGMGIFMKQYGNMKLSHKIISNSGFAQSDCLNVAGASAENVIIPTPSYSPNDSTNIKSVNFYKSYMKAYNRAPTITDANAYDAVNLISLGISKFGYDGVKVAEYIRNLKDYDGVAGKVSFTNGDIERPIIFKIVKNGKVENY